LTVPLLLKSPAREIVRLVSVLLPLMTPLGGDGVTLLSSKLAGPIAVFVGRASVVNMAGEPDLAAGRGMVHVQKG
jgi:hypothetical protein